MAAKTTSESLSLTMGIPSWTLETATFSLSLSLSLSLDFGGARTTRRSSGHRISPEREVGVFASEYIVNSYSRISAFLFRFSISLFGILLFFHLCTKLHNSPLEFLFFIFILAPIHINHSILENYNPNIWS